MITNEKVINTNIHYDIEGDSFEELLQLHAQLKSRVKKILKELEIADYFLETENCDIEYPPILTGNLKKTGLKSYFSFIIKSAAGRKKFIARVQKEGFNYFGSSWKSNSHKKPFKRIALSSICFNLKNPPARTGKDKVIASLTKQANEIYAFAHKLNLHRDAEINCTLLKSPNLPKNPEASGFVIFGYKNEKECLKAMREFLKKTNYYYSYSVQIRYDDA